MRIILLHPIIQENKWQVPGERCELLQEVRVERKTCDEPIKKSFRFTRVCKYKGTALFETNSMGLTLESTPLPHLFPFSMLSCLNLYLPIKNN